MLQLCIRQFCHRKSCHQQPYYCHPSTLHSFITDTDTVEICIDTGANILIVNDKTLLTDFIATKSKFKGVRSNPTTVGGTRTFNLYLQFNNGIHDRISAKKAIYVPTSPYNMITPQLILQFMRDKGCVAHMSQVGECEFLLHYFQQTEVKFRTLAILISSNGLFLFRTSQG